MQTATLPEVTPDVTEEVDVVPVEGTTTSQINVRMGPSTASASLGTIGIFVKVQIVGREASGNWYQVLYAESETGKGWLRAEYVQVDPDAEIRLVETGSASGWAVSGFVTRGVNVRSEPDIQSELLGVLNSNDVVFITGRDAGGKWVQIEFPGAADGKGWITAEFAQAVAGETAAPTVDVPTPGVTVQTATQDGDSMQAPLAEVVFSVTGSRILQFNGDVSAPDGDNEDWVRFTSQGGAVSIQLTCLEGAALRVELWDHGEPVGEFACGGASLASVTPGSDYLLRLIQNGAGYARYVLSLEVIP
jgi:uncharacterized protein YraI